MVTLWVSVFVSAQLSGSHFPVPWLCPESLWQMLGLELAAETGATTQLATLEVEPLRAPYQVGLSRVTEGNMVGSL